MHAIALRARCRSSRNAAAYDDDETAGLADQFGPRTAGRQTLKPFLWMQCSTMVQGFSDTTMVELPMPVTFDLEVTASKYLHQLAESVTVPLVFLFSGTCFTRGETGFGVEQVPWHLEDILPDAGVGVAELHGPALPRQRLAAPRTGTTMAELTGTRRPTA